MSAEQPIELEGTISTVLPGTMFRVTLDNKHEVLAYISGKMRKHFVRLMAGDRVRLEMSPYHLAGAGLLYLPAQGFNASVIGNYVGQRMLNKRNTAPVGGYTTLDASIGYNFGRVVSAGFPVIVGHMSTNMSLGTAIGIDAGLAYAIVVVSVLMHSKGNSNLPTCSSLAKRNHRRHHRVLAQCCRCRWEQIRA